MSKQPHPDVSLGRSAGPPPGAGIGLVGDCPPAATTRTRRPLPRGLIFTALTVICLLIAGGSIARAGLRQRAMGLTAASPPPVAATAGDTEGVAALRARPHLIFRSTARDDTFGKIALAPLDAPEGPRGVTALRCDRVYAAADRGLCLTAKRGVGAKYSAQVLDAALQPGAAEALGGIGIPSRTRVSPDGRYAAITVFVSGHSYAAGTFSTHTTLIDTASGAPIAELEEFAVWRSGARFQAPDFNFWGVTFARDSNRFYATLGTDGKHYLVEGDIAARRLRVVHEGVECPSLSPDGTRVAFKKQVGAEGRADWRIHVLDLATLAETPLSGETRNVDDQIEWLDDGHVLYALPDDADPTTSGGVTNVWVLPADGGRQPRLFLPQAASPVVVR